MSDTPGPSKPPKSVRSSAAAGGPSDNDKKNKRRKKSRSKSKSQPVTGPDNNSNKFGSGSQLFSLQGLQELDLDSEFEMESAMLKLNEPEPGPSNSKKRKQNPPPPPHVVSEEGEIQEGGFEDNQDYIAFAQDSEEDEGPEPVRNDRDRRRDSRKQRRSRSRSPGPSRNWGKGYDPSTSKRIPWCDGLDLSQSRNAAELLHKEVEAFTHYMSPTPQEDQVRAMIVSLIQQAIQSTFSDATVKPFGSFSTKLYLPSGDIDLVITSRTMAYSAKLNVLQALAAALKNNGITNKVQIIAKAKVPIVKFVTKQDLGAFNVDISVNQGNGLDALKIVQAFLGDEQKKGAKGIGMGIALRALVLVTKHFLSQRSMNEVFTGGLGSYSIVCLAISFLQMHPKIRNGHIDPSKNLGVLLMEFFELYGVYFNYEDVGISLRNGGSYFRKRERGWFDYYNSKRLSIEDPADDTNDISVGSYGYPKVRTTLAGAYGILTSSAYLKATMIGSRREGRDFRFDRGYHRDDNAEYSILSSIVSVSQETINHRRLVDEIWRDGALHAWCGWKKVDPEVEAQQKKTEANGTERVEKGKKGRDKGKGREVHVFDEERGVTEVLVEDEDHGDERDMVLSSGDEFDSGGKEMKKSKKGGKTKGKEKGKQKAPTTSDNHHEDEEEDEGRYAIGRGPPAKKRKLAGGNGSKDGSEAFYVGATSSSESSSDSESDDQQTEEDNETNDTADELVLNIIDEARKDVEVSDSAPEEGEEDADGTKEERDKRKRDYWLSKGMGGNIDAESDSE